MAATAAFLLAGSAGSEIPAPPGDYVEIDGARIRYVEEGSGPAVLVIHGASSNGEDMRLALSGHLDGYRAVYIDRPGLGWSERPDGRWTPEREAALIRALMEELALEDPIVVGHSWGGAITMRLAIDHGSDLTGLVLIAPALRSDVGEAAWYNRASRIPVLGPLVTRVFVPILGPRQIDSGLETTFAPQPVPDGYAETVRINRLFNPSVFKANAADMAPVNRHLAAQEERYSEVSLPTVILAGPNDEVVYTHMHSGRVVETMPNARLETDADWGHMLHHYAADRVRAAIDAVADGDLD
ncbi:MULTISPECIES: alpha/beta fold hydrolase [Hyphobacterium]|uniref:Alpha/beta fold hydrolase n=1 Tax=Hyphobacterium vulgare TaxID=1736751 RepID=A0ABV6ZW70_9PROT